MPATKDEVEVPVTEHSYFDLCCETDSEEATLSEWLRDLEHHAELDKYFEFGPLAAGQFLALLREALPEVPIAPIPKDRTDEQTDRT